MKPNPARTSLRMLALTLAGAALSLTVACGGGDDNTDTPSASAVNSGSPGVTARPGTSGSGSPGPTSSALEPAICSPADAQVGLVSQTTFGGSGGTFLPGQPIDITLTVANCGDNDAVLHYPTTQRYDFTIVDANNVEVWTAQDGKTFGQVEGTETLPPATEVIYEETWDQKDRNGAQVPDGQYKVTTFSVGCGVAVQQGCHFGPVRQVIISATASTPQPTAVP